MTPAALLGLLREQLRALGASPAAKVSQVAPYPQALSRELAAWSETLGTDVTAPKIGTLRPLEAVTLTVASDGAALGPAVARFRGLFAGVSPIVLGAESTLFASWAPLPSGMSQTYELDAKDQLKRRKPSIGSALAASLEAPLPTFAKAYAAADKASLGDHFEPMLDPMTLWKASEWIAEAFLQVSTSTLEEALGGALPFRDWMASKTLLATWPQLAHYWLVAHWAFGNDEALDETLDLTSQLSHPGTVELRTWLRRGQMPTAAERLRPTLTAIAPARTIGADARKRLLAAENELKQESPEVIAARSELRADPATLGARKLFEELLGLALQDASSATVYRRKPLAIDELAAALDARWLPILEYHQRLASRFPDSHKMSIPGLIVGLAKLSPDYATFRRTLDGMGTSTFGLERQREHAVAVGHFLHEPEAREWLVSRASAWAERIDEWDVPVSPAFEQVLLLHPLPETFALVTRVLSAKRFHGGNWRICVAAALAAGKLDATPCRDAVVGALARGLGRADNGERAAIEESLARLTHASTGSAPVQADT